MEKRGTPEWGSNPKSAEIQNSLCPVVCGCGGGGVGGGEEVWKPTFNF